MWLAGVVASVAFEGGVLAEGERCPAGVPASEVAEANVSGNHFSTVVSSRNQFQGIIILRHQVLRDRFQ